MVKQLVDDETETSSDQRSRIQAELLLGKLEPLDPDLGENKNMTLDSAMKKVGSTKPKVKQTMVFVTTDAKFKNILSKNNKEFLDIDDITDAETESQEEEEEEYADENQEEEHKA